MEGKIHNAVNNKCIVCGDEFNVGDYIQAFLRSPDDPSGSFCAPVIVDPKFHDRIIENKDTVKRKHLNCDMPKQEQESQPISPSCHLCKTQMGFDFSNNIWCKNIDCLLFDHIYDASTYPDQILVQQVNAIRNAIIAEFFNESNQEPKMRKIYKYTLDDKNVSFTVPKGSKILDAKLQKTGIAGAEEVVVWFLVETGCIENETRHFSCYMTGQSIPDDVDLKHINTLITKNGIVIHVFEVSTLGGGK